MKLIERKDKLINAHIDSKNKMIANASAITEAMTLATTENSNKNILSDLQENKKKIE